MKNATMTRWQHTERILREDAYRTIDGQPEVLLEGDGGPVGMKADLILARFLGFDDQIIEDGYRLNRVESEWLMPIHPRLTVSEPDPMVPFMRVARYVLQQGYATTRVAAEHLDPGIPYDMTTFTATLLYVRYRRRA